MIDYNKLSKYDFIKISDNELEIIDIDYNVHKVLKAVLEKIFNFYEEMKTYIRNLKNGDIVLVTDSTKRITKAKVVSINKDRKGRISTITFEITYDHGSYRGKINIKDPTIFNDIIYKDIRWYEISNIVDAFIKYPNTLYISIKYIEDEITEIYNKIIGGN